MESNEGLGTFSSFLRRFLCKVDIGVNFHNFALFNLASNTQTFIFRLKCSNT